jgi:nicotinate-nucleotide--dimethylbenzimidazole phosphoribosyltransferase
MADPTRPPGTDSASADAPPLAGTATGAAAAEGGADSGGAVSALVTRLQRRAAGAGLVRPRMPRSVGRESAGLSLRPGLHDRLAARAAASPGAMPTPGQIDGGRANGGSLLWRAATAARATGRGGPVASAVVPERPSMPATIAARGRQAAMSMALRGTRAVATLARRIMSDGAAAPSGQAGSPPPSPHRTTAVAPSAPGVAATGAPPLAPQRAGEQSGSGEVAASEASVLPRPTGDPSAAAAGPVAHMGPPALSASAARPDAAARSMAVPGETPSRRDDGPHGATTRVDRRTDDPRRDAVAPAPLVRTAPAAAAVGLPLARRVPGARPAPGPALDAAVHPLRQASGPARDPLPAVAATIPTVAASGAAPGALRGSPLSPVVARRGETSTPHRETSEAVTVRPMPMAVSLAQAREAAAPASTQATLGLAGSGLANPGPTRTRSSAGVATASDGAETAKTSRSGEGEPPRMAIAHAVRLDGATPISGTVARRVSSDLPLVTARKLNSDDAPAAAATFDRAAPAMARVAATSLAAAAPVAPTLVWRAPDSLATRVAPARPSDQAGTVLMRATAEAPAATAPGAPATEPAAPGDAATPALDIPHLAEQVTRLIARRLEIEGERRGGRRWA